MAQTILIKRGLNANRTGFTPLAGEILWTSDVHELWIGDGSTAGGLKVTAAVETSVSGLDTRLTTAETSITNNATAISTNATNISNNTTAISNNTTNITTNATAISNLSNTTVNTVNSISPTSGDVTLDTDDINEGSTNLYYTTARADSRIQAAIDDSSTSTTTLWSSSQIDSKLTAGAQYKGLWQADGSSGPGTPALSDATGSNGDFYIVEIGGDASFDGGTTTTTFGAGDRIMYESTNSKWQRVVTADAVDSVNGQTGVVTLNLNDINDVSVAAPSTNQVLSWDGGSSAWVAVNPGSITTTEFTSLTDVQSSYTGEAGTFVRVNATEDAVEFSTASITELTDVDTLTTAPTSGQVLAWDGTSKWVPATNTDTTYTAGTGLDLTGTVFSLSSGIDGLTDVDTTTVAPVLNNILKYDGTNWVPGADNTNTSFTGLADTPANYTGASGYNVQVNGAGDALEFVDTSVVDGGTF